MQLDEMTHQKQVAGISSSRRWLFILLAGGVLILLAFGLAWISNRFLGVSDWAAFLIVLVIGGGILLGGWGLLKRDRALSLPSWLAWLVLGAALLRLAAGAFWFVALPAWGYGSPVEKTGYIMSDARGRDISAWRLASSSAPLWQAFTGQYKSDQYGGLLFLSALVYRYLSLEVRRPLLIVILTASFSALGVLFGWGFARRAWGERQALITAAILAVYPEAVLLGSSQMREAFTMALVPAAFYGLARYRQERSPAGLGWMLGALLLCLPFSPAFAALLFGLLLVQLLSLEGLQVFRRRWMWLLFGVFSIMAVAALWLTWGRLAPAKVTNPLELFAWWVNQTARWQSYFVRHSSVLLRKTLKFMPAWAQMLILTGYGVLQPFLPAALVESSAPIWRAIAIWRALGWIFLLLFLVYGLFLAWGRPRRDQWSPGLSLVVWAGIVIASVRSGGDQWDNPRYRVAFAGLQAALFAWVWVEHRNRPSPWLRRIILAGGAIMVWFLLWYCGRYLGLPWPVTDVVRTVGLGLASAVLAVFWDWAHRINP